MKFETAIIGVKNHESQTWTLMQPLRLSELSSEIIIIKDDKTT